MNSEKQQAPRSIAGGAELDAVTWADFVERLRHDCEGEGVAKHFTADAIFEVQARRYVCGIDREYAAETVAVVDAESVYTSPADFYQNELDDEGRARFDAAARDDHDVASFLDLDAYLQWDMIEDEDSVTVTGRSERWEHVCSHFTHAAAEAFIRRKKHDYRDGLRVYVNSSLYCWEFNTIKAAILGGQITFVPKENTK